MKNIISYLKVFLDIFILLLAIVSQVHAFNPKRLLVVTVTKGFKHQSIPLLEKTIEDLGKIDDKFTVDFARTDEDLATKMTATALQNYDGVVFASTTGDLPLPNREAFLNWVKNGHAFIGVHSATDTFHGYSLFTEMIGGEFATHGPQLKVTLNLDDAKHAATKHFGKTIEIFEEIYTFKIFHGDKVRVLLSLDKNPNQKDVEGFGKAGFYPIAWCQNYGKGRVFYTALGHRDDVVESEMFRKHLLGGILWTLKKAKGSGKPQV